MSWSLCKLRVINNLIPKKYILLSTCHFHLAEHFKNNQFSNSDTAADDLSVTYNFLSRFARGCCTASCTQSLVSTSCKKKALAPIDEIEEICPEWEQPRVIIVGAGLAGLSAAHRLSQSGINNFLVLEASDRPGGRVMTAWLGDVVVEVGAEWIYGGSPANPAYVLAALEQILPEQNCVDGLTFQDAPPYYLTSGKALLDTALEQMIFDEIIRGAAMNCGKIKSSAAQYLSFRINQELKHFPKEKQKDAEKILYGMLGHVQAMSGTSLDELSIATFNQDRVLPGGNIRVPQGMAGILSPYILAITCIDSIRYNSPVERIKWNNSGDGPRAIVQISDGPQYEADYVIVTVPLGVLKACPGLFSPELPEVKQRAIDKIGFGKMEHIYAEYTNAWWACPQPLRIAKTPDELASKDDWTDGISTIDPKPGSLHILSTTISGADADLLDEVVEESIAIDLTKMIRKHTGDPSIPYPINILRSKWGANQCFRGSKAYMGVNTRPGHIKTLAESVPEPCLYANSGDSKNAPVLFFAGEATSVDHYGTMHGAIITGTKQATKIIEYTREFKGVPVCIEKNECVKQLSGSC